MLIFLICTHPCRCARIYVYRHRNCGIFLRAETLKLELRYISCLCFNFSEWNDSSRSKTNATKCLQCGKTFLKQRDLVFHAKHVCDQKRKSRSVKSAGAFLYGGNLDCNQCGKTFKRQKDLNYHIRHLCGIRGIQCPYCSKCYTYTSNVKYHISRYHEGKKVYYNKLF